MTASQMSVKINKNSPKTKKIVTKLAKKYCPLEEDKRKSPKGYQHLLQKQNNPVKKHPSHQKAKIGQAVVTVVQ